MGELTLRASSKPSPSRTGGEPISIGARRPDLRGMSYDEGAARLRPGAGSSPDILQLKEEEHTGQRPSMNEWRKETNSIKASAREMGSEDERRGRMADSLESMVGATEWGSVDPSYGTIGCSHTPFIALQKAGILTIAQVRHLMGEDPIRRPNVDGMQLILEALAFTPYSETPPSRRYPEGRPRAGDIAVFTEKDAKTPWFEHVAVCTGQGDGIYSLQVNYDESASSNPLMKTDIATYIAKLSHPDVGVVYCPFPF